MAVRTARFFAFVVALPSVIALGAGCSAAAAPTAEDGEAQGETTSQVKAAGTCGELPKNPRCDTDSFAINAYRLAKEEGVGATLQHAITAKDCIDELIEAGGLAAEGAVVLSAAMVTKQILDPASECNETADYLGRIGLWDNLSCMGNPVVFDDKVGTCDATTKCRAGVLNDGFGALPEKTRFEYGVSGGTNLDVGWWCTNDPHEAKCERACETWASTSLTDCKCLKSRHGH